MEMESENGWILPNGRYIECRYNEHIECAEEELGTTEKELEKTAVKVSCMPMSVWYGIFPGQEYKPNFLTRRKKMTKAQLATIEKYCLRFRYRPPLDYFLQKDLIELAEMSTKDILFILKQSKE
ncbi:MAG: hypothetical protein PHF35_04885 [Candidatus Moranbacteria bacterium]|nr:hypothetical protein [Candidatus Moranbacteria bacterium]